MRACELSVAHLCVGLSVLWPFVAIALRLVLELALEVCEAGSKMKILVHILAPAGLLSNRGIGCVHHRCW